MKNKLTIVSFTIAFICSTTLCATSSTLKANQLVKCPDVNAIIAAGVMDAEPIGDTWGAYREDKYGSDRTWFFMIGHIKADDVKSANSKVKQALPTLQFLDGPNNTAGLLTCNYKMDLDASVAAISTELAQDSVQQHIIRMRKD